MKKAGNLAVITIMFCSSTLSERETITPITGLFYDLPTILLYACIPCGDSAGVQELALHQLTANFSVHCMALFYQKYEHN